MSVSEARVRNDGHLVILEIEGRAFPLPYQAAMGLAQALRIKALAAEEIARAANIAQDQAMLMASGAPFGVTNNAKILKEAAKLAPDVKLPGGVRPTSVCGTPSIHLVGGPKCPSITKS